MNRSTLATWPLALSMALTLLSLPPAESQVPPDPLDEVVLVGVQASLEAPNKVLAGSTFKGMATVSIRGDVGIDIVEIAVLDDDTDQCGVGSVDVTGGYDLGNNRFLIGNLPAIFDGELQQTQPFILPAFVRVNIGYNTEDLPGGTCKPKANVVALSDPLNVIPLSDIVELQAPAIPVSMGSITTIGRWDEEDRAIVTLPATPVLTYTVVSPDPKLILQGLASHSPTKNVGDFGKFWFSSSAGDAVPDSRLRLSEETVGQTFDVVADVPYSEDEQVDTEYCFEAVYVDTAGTYPWVGYIGANEKNPEKTCALVSAVTPDLDEIASDVCALFASQIVQTQFLTQPVAYLIPLTGPFAGTAVNIAKEYWDDTCESLIGSHQSTGTVP